MKILYVITQGEQGGAQKYVFDLALNMHQLGHEVHVAIGAIENEGDKWLFEKLKTEPGLNDLTRFHEIKNLQREVNFIKAIKAFFEMRQLAKKINPEIVHLNSVMAGTVGSLAFKLSGQKVVYTVHGFAFLEKINIFKKIFYIFSEFISSFFRDCTILISQKDIQAGKKFGILGDEKNYKLIYNGVDESLKEKIWPKESARGFIFNKIGKKDEGQKIVGTIANLFKTKGLEYFIDSAAKIVGAKALPFGEGLGGAVFVVFGFGPETYRQELKNRINKNNLQNNFFLLGKTPDAYKYLKAFDVFTLTSVKEGLPYTLLEAHMAGVPIVATAVGGIPEMAQHIKISLAESQNMPDIAGKILFEIQKGINEGKNNDLPEVYKLENCIEKTLQVYKKMLN